MSAKLWTPCIVLIVLAASGCERAAAPEEFPQAAADGWLGSFNGGDVDGLVLMYSADAQLLPPDEPIIAGAESIQKFWKEYNPGQVRIEVGEADTEKLGDFWLREGSYKAQFPDEGEPRVGKFIELWEKENGNWLLYRQMWNRNAPLAPEAVEDATADEPA
jgi:ketosteroid isomerase-like protein